MLLIIGIHPINNQMNVPINEEIEVLFSKALEKSTVDPNTIFIQDVTTGEKVPNQLTYDEVNMQVVLKPLSSLQNGKKYRITIIGRNMGVISKDGEILAAHMVYDFTTEPGTFIPPVTPLPTNPPATGNPDPMDPVMLIEVVDTYPKDNSVHVEPKTIKVLLTSPINPSSVTHESVYLIKKRKPTELNIIDLMTEYSPSNSVLTEVNNAITMENNDTMISIQITEDLLEPNTEYTLIVRESITDGTSTLGIPYMTSFYTTFTPLYADPLAMRESMKTFFSSVTDIAMYRRIREASIEARDIVTKRDATIDLEIAVPYYMEQYVTHKAVYELAVNAYLQDSKTSSGDRSLGDLSIGAGEEAKDVTKLLRDLKGRIKPWLDQLHGHNNRGYAKPAVAVRGENIEVYPDFLDKTEFSELGG